MCQTGGSVCYEQYLVPQGIILKYDPASDYTSRGRYNLQSLADSFAAEKRMCGVGGGVLKRDSWLTDTVNA